MPLPVKEHMKWHVDMSLVVFDCLSKKRQKQRWPADKPDRSWCCRIFFKTLSVVFCLLFVVLFLRLSCLMLIQQKFLKAPQRWPWQPRHILFNTAVSCLLSVVSCIVSALVLSGVDSECSSAGAGRQTRQIRLLCRSSMQQGVNKMHSDKSIKQSKRRNNTFDKSHVIVLTIWVFCENKEYVIDANFQSLVWY